MSKEDKVSIHFKITGTELDADKGYDLYYLSQTMDLFHQLMEKTYLILKDEKHMSKSKRDDLKIKVFNIREGSFEADFQLLVTHIIPSMLPMVSALNAKNIWEVAKMSYEYLITILKANREGKTVTLNEVNAENSQVVVGDNNVILNVHPDVVMAANNTYPVYKKIGKLIDEKDKTLEKVIFGDESKENKNIEIGVEEKMFLQNPNILDQVPVKFKGKIFNADANKYRGKLEVIESEDIDKGEYSFEFIDKENTIIKDYFDIEGGFIALKLTSFNPNTLKRSVNRLEIVSVNLSS